MMALLQIMADKNYIPRHEAGMCGYGHRAHVVSVAIGLLQISPDLLSKKSGKTQIKK